jgi:ABC-type sugar transport system ATPase subunit
MRFYDPSSGVVSFDGIDLKQLDARWLRRHVALVAQEPVLFGCSVADNIAYAVRARAAADAAWPAAVVGEMPPVACAATADGATLAFTFTRAFAAAAIQAEAAAARTVRGECQRRVRARLCIVGKVRLLS